MPNPLKRLSPYSPLLFALAAAILLWPYFTTGYYYDDSLNADILSYVELRNITIWKHIGNVIWHNISVEGRFFPLAPFVFLSYCFSNLLAYRILQLAFVSANLCVFIGWLRSHQMGRDLSFVTSLILLALFQLRDYHDP